MLATFKGGPHDGELREVNADPIMGISETSIVLGDNARYDLLGVRLAGPSPDSDYVRYAIYNFRSAS